MYPLTLNRPKALLPLGGRPIIDYIIDQINTLPEVDEIIVVSNHKFYPQFKKWAEKAESKIPIDVINDGTIDENSRLGAIGDIQFTLRLKKIDDDVVIIAGDNYTTYPLIEQYEFFKEKQKDVVCVQKIENKKALKQLAVAVLDENGKVLSLEEKPKEPKSNNAAFATYFYRKDTLPLFDQYLKDGEIMDAPGFFVQWLHKKRDVYAYIMNGQCYDIGTIETYEAMKKILSVEEIMNIKESDEYIAITGMYNDDSGKLNCQLMNKQFIQFASGSKVVSEMVGNRASVDEILMFILKNRAAHLAGKREFLSDEELTALMEALEELGTRGAFKDLKLHLRKQMAR